MYHRSRPRRQITAKRLTSAVVASIGAVSLAAVAGVPAASAHGVAHLHAAPKYNLSNITLYIGDQEQKTEALLKASGQLSSVKYHIVWSEFTSGPPELVALGANGINVATSVGDAPPIFAAAAGPSEASVRVVGAFDPQGDGNAILVPKGSTITSVAQLKGKSVAYSSGSSANLTLLLALKKAGLHLNEITSDLLQPTAALPAFNDGQIDAWVVWYPFVAEAEAAGARVLELGTTLDPGYNFTLSNTNTLADKAKAAAIGDLIHRLGLAQIWADKHLDTWSSIYAQLTGLTVAEATETEKISENQVEIPITQALITAEQKAANSFTGAGVISAITFKNIIDEQFNSDVPSTSSSS